MLSEYLRVDLDILHDAANPAQKQAGDGAKTRLGGDIILQYAEEKYLAAQQAALQSVNELEPPDDSQL